MSRRSLSRLSDPRSSSATGLSIAARSTLSVLSIGDDVRRHYGSLATRPSGSGSALLQRADHLDRHHPSNAEITTALLGAELTEFTRHELVILAPAPHHVCLPLEVFGFLRSRKVEVRVLYTANCDPLTDPVATLARGGIALPAPLDLPYFLVLRDRAVLYLPHQDSKRLDANRLTRLHSVVMGTCMAMAFNMVWETAFERQAPRIARDNVAGGGKDLLGVLSAGLTDDRAAERLHVSKRTFARRVADMMHLLNANTRFQAGVQAARRGWV